jgi:hypothetical protein
VGAMSVVPHSLKGWTIYAGNPVKGAGRPLPGTAFAGAAGQKQE